MTMQAGYNHFAQQKLSITAAVLTTSDVPCARRKHGSG